MEITEVCGTEVPLTAANKWSGLENLRDFPWICSIYSWITVETKLFYVRFAKNEKKISLKTV